MRNETYIGKKDIIVKLLKGESKEKCIELGQFEKVTQKTPIIIDEKLFNEVQKKINTSQKIINTKNVRKHTFLLNDLCYCGHCGNSIKSKYNPKQKNTSKTIKTYKFLGTPSSKP